MKMELECSVIALLISHFPGRIRQDNFEVMSRIDNLAVGVGGV